MEIYLNFLAELAREYAALLISICALFLTISQAKATSKHNRLSVKPHLTSFIETRNDLDRKGIVIVKVTLSNNGLGPAIIKNYELLLDGIPIQANNPGDLFPVVQKEIPASLMPDECFFTLLKSDYVMGKDEVVSIASISIVRTIHDDPKALDEALDRFHVRVGYESGYGESFVYDSREHRKPT